MFDRSFLPPAQFEFVVISDTHYIRDPEIYASGSDSQDPRFTRRWSGRAGYAMQLAAALEPAFVVHLGDLAQEYPGQPDFARSREEARAQIRASGLQPYHTPGNMDIGDKPNPTVPADWVTPEILADWHAQFGPSWYAFDHGDLHGVVLNSQIMNGPLPEAEAQDRWLAADLAEHSGRRLCLFLHMPLFFVDETEPGLGSYNSLDEPMRRRLLALLRQYPFELVFAGHTHFVSLNHVGAARLLIAPSTTTSRPGFVEVFSVLPENQGKDDLAKLGFYLVRVHESGSRVHLMRTNGQTENAPDSASRRLLTCTTPDLAHSPVGVCLRLPLAPAVPGVWTWPDAVRQRVRDDYPLLACLEMGAQHLRFPALDLEDDIQRTRLAVARREGLRLAPFWLWEADLELDGWALHYAGQIDSIELQAPGTLLPDPACLAEIDRCRKASQLPLTLAPLLGAERVPGKYHARMRVGYDAGEVTALNEHLRLHEVKVDRALCLVRPEAQPWPALLEFARVLPLSQIGALDFVVPLPGLDEAAQAARAAEAVLASALLPGCRLYLDPLVDVDRSSDINLGLLDRLSNPRPAFQAVRCLNTILFGLPDEYQALEGPAGGLALQGRTRRLRLLLPGDTLTLEDMPAASEVVIYDLIAGESLTLDAATARQHLQSDATGPRLIVLSEGAS